ncbi:hypothetical protein D3C74_488420 [compost metagenome]
MKTDLVFASTTKIISEIIRSEPEIVLLRSQILCLNILYLTTRVRYSDFHGNHIGCETIHL